MVASKCTFQAFDCWITDRLGVVRHILVDAIDQESAIVLAMAMVPRATAASCRQADRDGPPRDALAELAELARRADERGAP